MPAMVSIQMAREIVHATRMTADESQQEVAVYPFQQGKLSFGEARQMAGMTRRRDHSGNCLVAGESRFSAGWRTGRRFASPTPSANAWPR